MINTSEKLSEGSSITGKFKIITHKAGTKIVLRETEWSHNLVMNGTSTGKQLILQRLNGTNTYSLNITYADIGTGSTAVAITDTQLTTPTVRAAKSTGSLASNVLTLQFFFSDAVLANGTYYEFGTFVDGTSTISTGQIFNHALFATPYTKASGEDTTIQLDITLT